MPIAVQCTECEKKFKVPDEVAGKKIRCPACKTVIAVPAAEEEFEQPDEEFETPDEETAVTQTPSPKKKKPDSDQFEASPKKRKKSEDDEDYGVDEDEEEEEQPRKKKKKRYDDDDDYDYREPRRRRAEPHRGVTILILGISSIVVACLCPLICWILAAIAVNMANTDKPKIERGVMDKDGAGMTTAGQVCAYVGVILGLINCVGGIALQVAQKGGNF
jgi:phage FluMu protein Com